MVRIKERYVLVNILYPPDVSKQQAPNVPDFVVMHQPTTGSLTPQSLLKAIRAEVATLFGDYGSGAIEGNLQVKYLSPATSTFILKVKRAHYRLVWAALTFMTCVPLKTGDGKPCTFKVVRVSGTIRKAEEEAVRQARQLVLAAKDSAAAAANGALPMFTESKAQVEDTIMFDASDVSDEDDMVEEDG
ncbi:Rpp14/Pop5 family protein [Colletotrichum tofieldiae]|uniref:Ribonuclease P/MRP protein subunit POP5 n=2 Tax=Colletotrichum spaethianum species complex TaxID=2707349 RepID=A0A166VU17_9PEZI|nr:Rpp14/Pop5 family protein [Colletotrichum tofieldiae]GJC79085.1 ribonuclease P/MRP protein subunit POP5 [Colletotrichum liriopes]GKT59341.1 Rpp14/Pop5 family protein [Colletotrichum tofieldiae]GKT85499.1 Rpp14/Pop5 family protein [Colletotrichum tofieldiae]